MHEPNGFRFLLLSNTVHEIREKLFPWVQSEIKIPKNFSRETWKSKIREIKLPQKSPTTRFQEMW